MYGGTTGTDPENFPINPKRMHLLSILPQMLITFQKVGPKSPPPF